MIATISFDALPEWNSISWAETLFRIAFDSSHVSSGELFYWHREARSRNAEVDYVVRVGSTIVPIEVKAGARGRMKSLRVYLTEKKNARGVRISLDRLALVDGLIDLPLYAISQLGRLVEQYGPTTVCS